MMRKLIRICAALAIGACLESVAGAAEAPVAAEWKSHTLDFEFHGFTTSYSCDGLHDSMTHMLTQLGAQKGFTVNRYSCGIHNGPTPFPSVELTFSSLAPVDTTARSAAQPAIQARWQKVTVNTGEQSIDDADCELMEQVKHDLLPLFATRNVGSINDCVPHQANIGPSQISVETLKPLP